MLPQSQQYTEMEEKVIYFSNHAIAIINCRDVFCNFTQIHINSSTIIAKLELSTGVE